jgi:hypothetical protein
MGKGDHRFTLENDPVICCVGEWMGPRAGLYGHKNLASHKDSIPGPSSP